MSMNAGDLMMPEIQNASRYGFYARLKAEFPSQLLVDAAEICNLACVHCPHPQFKVSERYEGRSLDPELNAKLVHEVSEHGRGHTQYIRYASNGEPLTHKSIFEMLDYAVRHSSVMVTLTTNGKTLDAGKAERLVPMGVDVVDIGIDAFLPETYAAIRVGRNLSVTRANVLRLIAECRKTASRTKVVVSYVEQPLNRRETDDFERFWKDSGANSVVIRRLHSCSGAKAELAAERRAIGARQTRRPCLYPWERIVLNARGHLGFCPSDWVHGSVIADYRNTTIYDAWRGEFYRKLRQAHMTNDFVRHTFCGQRPDWQSTRWPDEGRSYANMIEEFKDTE
jgi:MoaA/NifB/PqqE/SkfB family radical SAM enzyme